MHKTKKMIYIYIYIVDNSPNTSNYEFFKDIPNSSYYHNKNKGGIAGAHNLGCKKAAEAGFDWVMLMDQDSRFEPENFRKYLSLFSEYAEKDGKAKSFTLRMRNANRNILSLQELARYKILSPLKRKIMHDKNKTYHKAGSEFYDGSPITFPHIFVLASANIINLPVWRELGGFDESLFIDQVDNDFCIRLVARGYKIVRFNEIVFSHSVGEKHFSILKKRQPLYNSFRLYYIFRNHFIMYERYHKYRFAYRRLIKDFFIDNCIFSVFCIRNLCIFIRAYKDYKKYMKQKHDSDYTK